MSLTDDDDTPTLVWPPVEAMRDRFDRYAGAMHEGREKPWSHPSSRVSSILGRIEDKYTITRWEWQCMAEGLCSEDKHLVALKEVVALGNNEMTRSFMETMGEAGGSRDAAARGTRYHELVGKTLAGVKLDSDVTLTERRDIKAILAELEKHSIEVIDLERIVLNKEYDYAGTLDYMLSVPRIPLPVIGDLKTGGRMDLSFTKNQGQEAAYAHASHMVTDEGDLVPMAQVDQDVGIIVHCIPGSAECKLIGTDLTAGWRTFRLALRVHGHGRGRGRLLDFNDTLRLWEQVQADREFARSRWARDRVDALRKLTTKRNDLKATQFLRSIWPESVALPSQCDSWEGDDLQRVIAAITIAEAEYEAPFFANDPTQSR